MGRGKYWDGWRKFDPGRELLEKLYLRERMTQVEIAKYFGVSVSTIRNKIAEYELYKYGKKS